MGLSCPSVRLLPFTLPLSHRVLVRFEWLDKSTELCAGIAALGKRAMCQCGALSNAETTVAAFPLLG